jgi:hypothetical protein
MARKRDVNAFAQPPEHARIEQREHKAQEHEGHLRFVHVFSLAICLQSELQRLPRQDAKPRRNAKSGLLALKQQLHHMPPRMAPINTKALPIGVNS